MELIYWIKLGVLCVWVPVLIWGFVELHKFEKLFKRRRKLKFNKNLPQNYSESHGGLSISNFLTVREEPYPGTRRTEKQDGSSNKFSSVDRSGSDQ